MTTYFDKYVVRRKKSERNLNLDTSIPSILHVYKVYNVQCIYLVLKDIF